MENYLGQNIPKLGFGLMRLPMLNETTIDMEQTKKMVDYFIAEGFTYFDTAYVYIGGKSEVALKEAVVERYPRDAFQAATKMPMHAIENREDMQKIFDESCDRAGLAFYDFYLLHALSKESAEKADRIGAWDFIKDMKNQGKVKHIGFSFHDSAEVLRDILTKHPETEFVQLQINYADWESPSVQAGACYEVAMEFEVPVIIMEPVKGGSLAAMTPEVQALFHSAAPDKSIASWAMRYAGSLNGLVTVLSGMSVEEQMKDNCATMKDMQKLTTEEAAVIDQAVKIMSAIDTIPCTTCKYCVDDCPQNINIPGILGVLNSLSLYNNPEGAKGSYGFTTRDAGKASDCIACGSCESRCPQHIKIIDALQTAAEKLEA